MNIDLFRNNDNDDDISENNYKDSRDEKMKETLKIISILITIILFIMVVCFFFSFSLTIPMNLFDRDSLLIIKMIR